MARTTAGGARGFTGASERRAGGEARLGLRIVRGQVDDGVPRAVGEDPVDRRDRDRGLRPDRVAAAGAELLEAVGRVAREEHMVAVVVDAQDRYVPGRVAG